MARPNKNEAIAKKKRDAEILAMSEKNYPLDYIASFFSLTKGRVVQIVKREKAKHEKQKGGGDG